MDYLPTLRLRPSVFNREGFGESLGLDVVTAQDGRPGWRLSAAWSRAASGPGRQSPPSRPPKTHAACRILRAQKVRYSDEDAAALYDLLNPWGTSDDFCLALVMEAGSVLDVGCGTGALLSRASDAGHAGRLCGVDPDRASLAVAQRRGDIEWVAGTAASMTLESEFDLAVMTGHAFQFLVDDDEVRASLAAIRRALVDGGRFAFETRNPLARTWESWTPANAIQIVDPAGRRVRVSYEVESVVDDLVTLTETTSDQHGVPLRVDRETLRFLDIDTLARFLATAGFQIEAQYGSWSREPLDTASAEIITIARVPRT